MKDQQIGNKYSRKFIFWRQQHIQKKVIVKRAFDSYTFNVSTFIIVNCIITGWETDYGRKNSRIGREKRIRGGLTQNILVCASRKAYEAFRDSGSIIALSSQHTLQDYSNAIKAGAGFTLEVDCQLHQADDLVNSSRYHSLIVIVLHIDEMHLRENLVYNW